MDATENAHALPALIEALIAGLGEEPLWARFLALFRRAVRADYASVVFRPFAPGATRPEVVHLFSGADSPPPISENYRERLYLRDPLPYDRLAPGRPYDLAELLDEGDPGHRAYREELLTPSGMNHLKIMRVEAIGGESAWLIASRRRPDFRARDVRLIEALAPYLRAALAARITQERERSARYVADEAMRRMNFGWLALDAAGRILDADPSADAILAAPDGPLSRGRDGRLRAREPEVGQALEGLLASVGKARRSRAVILSREPWLDMLILPVSLRPDGVRRTPSVVIYIHADRRTREDHYEHLNSLFGLTPREAHLALALSRGRSIAEAAEEMRLTTGSARTYTKRIYSKTGARGQSDLIRLMHRSVMALA